MRVVVVGSGIAGLNLALRASSLGEVLLITKKELVESNTNYAQGGIAAVIDRADKFEAHVQDTLQAGAGLCDEKAVKVLVKHAPQEIRELLNLGVGFNREFDGSLMLTREGGHHARRIAFAKDATGKEIERTLAQHARSNAKIDIWEEHIAYELVREGDKIISIKVFDPARGEIKEVRADFFILATGGLCQIYAKNSNPKIATGDGLSLAYKAGVSLVDLEFIQFHPTAFDHKDYPHFLISETLRGEGGILKNAQGRRFMHNYHKMKELAPRDVVARAILKEAEKGQVYLDMTQLKKSFLKARFPMIYERLWWYGLKMEREAIPVAPAAHYSCGGIMTDTFAQTNLKNLFAIGEVAATGVHGANRLASNSLMESLVFGTRAFEKLKTTEVQECKDAINRVSKNNLKAINKDKLEKIENSIKKTMWEKVGIVREKEGLEKALSTLESLESDFEKLRTKALHKNTLRVESLLTVAKLVTRSALLREESRGAHYRSDFPDKSEKWKKRIVVKGEERSYKNV